ncbi:ATP-binding cassette domain-containing protein [Streptacidiphilus jiangxiensis]|uniref:ABC-2 type transport system ATP-binding protein n=1 Tax=Streptacidiphilus jiangxiensis TaxID=235985 RepID=A0A1H7L508_STRJI|nr:ABC transporter ATP-binding protein [Streptacidiphilus jiangxiensis]SEK93914.1 ABC-2 type transport system ATP-binding protein [Streptacidiphilus jiangxiensis]
MIPGTAALEMVGLTVRHRRRTLLDACSLRLPRGAVCGLVGPNGAGKSLLLSAAAGLVAPDAGRITVLGRSAGSDRALPEVGFLDQHRSLYPRMTVAELLETGRRTNVRWHQDRALELLRLGRVPLGAKVGALSGGQRTLAALALVRGKAPQLMLLDEPLAELDPLVRRAVLGLLLADVADHGTTVLLSTHILTDLDEVVDHLVLLDSGQVRLAGELSELLAAHRYVDRDGGRVLVRQETGAPGDDAPTLDELVVCYLHAPGTGRWLAPGMRPDATQGALIA